MKKEDLIALKEKISNLNEEEKKQRDLYLRGISSGDIQGPMTGYASVDKPWLKWYKEENINISPENMTVYENFLDLTEKYGDSHVLLSFYGKKYTRKDIIDEVNKHKNLLHNNMGLRSGDCISLMMLDVPEVLFIWFAANELGIVCNMIKFDESHERIKRMLETTNSKYLFVTEFAPMVENAVNSINGVECINDIISVDMNNALNPEQMKKFLNEEIEMTIRSGKNYSPTDKVSLFEKIKNLVKIVLNQQNSKKQIAKLYSLTDRIKMYRKLIDEVSIKEIPIIAEYDKDSAVSVIVYTGGTTGAPKGVQLTNKNLNSMVYGVIYGDGEFNENQTSMNILPPGIAFYYNGVLSFMCHGINVDLISHFTEQTYPFIVDAHKPNVLVGGPILMEKTRKSNAIDDGSYIQISASGGDKLSMEEEIAYNNYLKDHGSDTNVHQGWGMSECAAVASYSTTKSYKTGTIGIPLINFEIGVFEYGTDKEMPYGEIGELCIHSDTIMKGYYNNEEATNSVLRKHSDGKIWLHSDDLGYIDSEGRLFHKGRIKRMLTRSGSKVWVTEIEDIVSSHSAVDKCCCVKYDDEKEREVPVIHIVLKDENVGLEPLVSDLISSIKNQLTDNYIPKYFVFREELPYSEVNKKVDYKELEQETILDYDVNGNIIIKKQKCQVKK